MSGIVGLFYLDKRPVDPADLAGMVDTLAHRGPDGADAWHQGRVGLGHRMLWTTPESLHEKLPLVSRNGEFVITADARIDNRAELIPRLGLSDRPSQEISDSELILAAYEKWGEACPEKLLGDFAFAIWDGPQQQLFCARDHFGVKPFYYHYQTGGIFTFASEIKALLCLPEVPRRLNEVRVGDFLTGSFEDKEITFYKDIIRLPPAATITVSHRGIQRRRYWEPDLTHELKLGGGDEYAEAFREIFTEAVRCRLRSAFPVGATLSGGLDSSSVVCTAAGVLAEHENRLHTFSAIFPSLAKVDPRIDERPYMEAVLASGAFEAHYIEADRLTPLVNKFWLDDEVLPAVNLYMEHALFGAASRQGVRVILTGHDGDSTISHGYERITELACTLQWKTLVRESNALAKKFNLRRRTVLWQRGVKPLLPEAVSQLWRRWRGHSQSGRLAKSAINPVFAQRIGLTERLKYFSHGGFGLGSTAQEWHWQSINSGLLQYGTELEDKIAGSLSIEARHPFFDKRLIEFCVALPLAQKLCNGWTRSILRYAMMDLLPQKICWRLSKGSLSANFCSGLLEKERETLEEIILSNPTNVAQYIDIPDLQQTYRRYTSQPLRYNQDALTINFAVVLALWLRHSGINP